MKKLIMVLLSLFFLFTAVSKVKAFTINNALNADTTKSYQNFLNLPKEWQDYGIGDPFVFRIDGRYYLYSSTKDSETGIKCWSSSNLIDWKYEGLAATDPVTQAAYAPEVVYSNGYYYMYTSPGGNGHYVLKSTSPKGPFKLATNNLGRSIDADVFIDDNGKWYFNHAGQKGIIQNEMKTPLTVDGADNILENAYMNGWTEGPGIFKRKDIYYLTYTGNHTLSDGYRINYAYSKEGPDKGYKSPVNNPLIISTDMDFSGLGHNLVTMGPDLDSYYIIYHNKVDEGSYGLCRKMNVDRLVFNGEKMSVLGPTNFQEPIPKMADFYAWLSDKNGINSFNTIKNGTNTLIISKIKSSDKYIAEFNFHFQSKGVLIANPKLEFVFSYKDPQNYMCVSLNTYTKDISLIEHVNGKTAVKATSVLFKASDLSVLHTIRVEKEDEDFQIYFDNLQKIKAECSVGGSGGGGGGGGGGAIGYLYGSIKPILDYTAFSDDVGGTSDYNVYKPLPGTIESIHFSKGYGEGYALNGTAANATELNHEKYGVLDGDSYYMILKNSQEFLKYNINVKEKGRYKADLMVRTNETGGALKLFIDDQQKAMLIIPKAEKENRWIKLGLEESDLDVGYHTLKLQNAEGEVAFKYITFYETSDASINFSDPMTKYLFKNWIPSGTWKANAEGFHDVDPDNSKAYTGSHTWTDYEITSKITYNKEQGTGEGGILFRVTNESVGYRQQVKDDLMGYYAGIDAHGVFLRKLNYGGTELLRKNIAVKLGKEYLFKVKAIANLVDIYLDDMNKQIIEYYDSDAFTHGKVGLYSGNQNIYFKDIQITNSIITN
jgi:xylan 1,4-beta-xylosidase